jgi:uncharacterized protein (TIGR03435 family)
VISLIAQPPSEFEVASVKIAPPRSGSSGFIAIDSDPAMIRYANTTLKMLIATAYRFNSNRILSGPAWVDSQLYDLAAKLPPGTPKDRVPAMLQSLLAEQFKLAVHRAMKDQRVYFLTVGKGGPRLKEAHAEERQDVEQVRGERLPLQIARGSINGHSIPLASFAGALAAVMGSEVIDRTGLTGKFDVDLKWTPEEDRGYGSELFAALQEQLGLKLKPGRTPVEFLVIDRAERIPAGN